MLFNLSIACFNNSFSKVARGLLLLFTNHHPNNEASSVIVFNYLIVTYFKSFSLSNISNSHFHSTRQGAQHPHPNIQTSLFPHISKKEDDSNFSIFITSAPESFKISLMPSRDLFCSISCSLSYL